MKLYLLTGRQTYSLTNYGIYSSESLAIDGMIFILKSKIEEIKKNSSKNEPLSRTIEEFFNKALNMVSGLTTSNLEDARYELTEILHIEERRINSAGEPNSLTRAYWNLRDRVFSEDYSIQEIELNETIKQKLYQE